ncbi:hypothetical protein CBR_g18564 [Chara braunii]|uniref:Integrase catalytic domain-containing protein n=1 Tax=Chara braunii TaxID=69332 RepID=A0A388JT39_CHABU|nr:hypothetical protein CBR_g18564 [Chara braunii]|eukprot:GBG60966.1 hypothetical protein CBR_g18564 [Chara braunii]
MTYRPPSRTGRAPHAVRTRAKGPVSPEEPAKDVPEPSGEKEVVDVPKEQDDEDDRLRKEEDEKAEQRAKKRGVKPDTDKAQEVKKKKKYAVRVEEGYDVEEIMDKILEGHNHLMNVKDVLASALRLRDELRARLSRKMVASVQLGTIIPKEAEWAETGTKMDWKSVACDCLDVVVKGKTCTVMVDSGAEMNIIKEEHAVRLGVEIDRSDNGVLMGANSRSIFIGTTSSVILEIGKVKIFDFELERIPGNKNRADGLSRVDWDKNNQGVIEDAPPVDGFLDNEEDVRLHINSWALAVGKCVTPGRPVWLAPPGHARRSDLVLKPYIEEDSKGMSDVDWMMELALAGKYQLHEDSLTIEDEVLQVGKQEKTIGGVYLLANALLQEEAVRNTVLDQEEVVEPGEGDNVIHERGDDDFEEVEIKEAFQAEEYEGVYLELGMLLSCEMRERDACARVLKMRPSFLMVDDYYKSCVPCQERSALRPRELLHPRYVREVGAVVHLDLLTMSLGIGSYNFIFNARDNLSGFVDGRSIRTKTGEMLAWCIEEYYLRYPFVSRFVMDRGSEFTCAEVKALLKKYGVIAEYTTAAHPQANAPVERGHNTITNLLAKWTDGRPNQWPNFLMVAFFVDNITVRRSTDYAPATLWYDRHTTFPIESFLKTWRRQDLETDLTFEELLDLRARQIGAIEDRIEEAASRTADSRTKDKFRWDKMTAAMPRGRGGAEPVETPLGATRQRAKMGTRREDRPPVFQGGNIELFLMEFERHAREFGWDGTRMLREVRGIGEWADPIVKMVRESLTWQDFQRRMEGLHPSPLGRDGQPIHFDSTNLGEFLWAYDRYADELDIPGEQRVGSFLLFVRHHIRPFVRSIVASAKNWGHCKKLLWNYYTPARQADERRGMKNRRRESEAEERATFEQGASSGTQRGERRKEHKSHRHERAGGSSGPGVPPQPTQREMDCLMPDAEPDIPHEPHAQELKEEQSSQEKELDRQERAAREQKIRTQLQMKNLAELHERVQQGKEPEEVEDRKGKGTCTQEEDPPLFSEVWMSFDKLMDVAGRTGGHHQEMGVKLVSTDLLNLRGVMKEGFTAAKASDQKIGDRLTKVAQKAYGQKVDWEREVEDLKKELGRQGKKLEAVKVETEKVWDENEIIRQVNQTLNRVTDALRAYLCAQQISFHAKEAKWEKRIQDLEAKYAQQTPMRVVDWTEIQRFEG